MVSYYSIYSLFVTGIWVYGTGIQKVVLLSSRVLMFHATMIDDRSQAVTTLITNASGLSAH